jgi:hypothetical protein
MIPKSLDLLVFQNYCSETYIPYCSESEEVGRTVTAGRAGRQEGQEGQEDRKSRVHRRQEADYSV